MKHISLFVAFAAGCILSLASCIREPMPGVKNRDKVQLSLKITTLGETEVETRSGEDAAINSVYVLIFDGAADDAKLIDWAEASAMGQSTYYASLKEQTTSGYVCILANVATNMADSDVSDLNTFGEVKSKLIVQLTMKNGQIVDDPRFSPMASGLLDYSAANALNDAEQIEVSLKRSTAKVTVTDKSGNASYTLLGTNLGNAPGKGHVFEGLGSIDELANYAGLVSGETYSLDQMMRGVSATDPKTTEPLYQFESQASNQPFVIVKGSYGGVVGYHRLNLWDRKTEKYLDVKRNYKYLITINKIATSGYRTAQQAIDSKASNRDVEYDITVVDPFSHDIVTNGEQYLGVSNSELVVYRTGAVSDFVATVLSFTVPTDQTWSSGVITAVGDGLTISGASGTAKTLSLPAAETKGKEIKVNFSAAFTSGSLIIQIGDMSKVVTITKKANLPAVPEEMKFSNMATGDRGLSGSMKKYIHFASHSGMYATPDNYDDIYTTSGDDIYTSVSANIGYGANVKERSGEFYIASDEDMGRTKVWFYQEKMDVYTEQVQLVPYSYVGTFHRADQTAERIIRVKPILSDHNQTWMAAVVVGEDFIELDTDRSPDPGITTYPYGYDESDPNNTAKYDNPVWTTDAEIEANCQFRPEQKGKSIVMGTGDMIYFRVGMKSKLAEGEAAKTTPPRYGLIALIHKFGVHLIYVRQGECEDYLLRSTDPMTDFTALSRNKSVKILPYNITVPDDKKSSKWYDVPVNGGALTQYPSQGGYFFKGNSRRAYYPVGTPSEAGWDNQIVTTGGTEVCPPGYRRPGDGVDGNQGLVDGSEMRQSFWLNPRNGEAQSNYDNMLRGYMADGYFDRRVIRVPNTQGHSNEGTDVYSQMPAVTIDGKSYGPFTIPTLVGEGAYCGYAGMLLYNPNNYASIFVPANGSRFGQTGTGIVTGTGAQSNLWSNTFKSGTSTMWYLATGYYYQSGGYKFVFDNYSSVAYLEGFSIRCVKE